jgi:hypothetical protein
VYADPPLPNGKLYKKVYPDNNGGYVFKPIKILSNGWANVIVDGVDCWIKNVMVYVYYGDSLVVDLYSEPSSRSVSIYRLEDGWPLIVIGFKDDWICVKIKRGKNWYRGWINKNNTDPSGI